MERLNEWGYALGQLLQGELQRGSVVALVVVFAAGVLTSLTPCVYPMYPVMVPYIWGAASGNRRRAIGLSATYVSGLAVIYASLGVVAALLGKTFGQFTRNPWVFAAVGLLILLFGIEMLDIYTLRLPTFLTGIQSAGVRRGGYFGALLLGVAAGFIAAPCTAPVLAVILTYVAAGQRPVWGGFLLLVFAIGMGLLLLLLGVFAGLVGSLPKPGRWMDWVKKGFGVVMVLIGGYFLWMAVRLWLARGGSA